MKKYAVPVRLGVAAGIALALTGSFKGPSLWQSRFVHETGHGTLSYPADSLGNRFPDFSRVGYEQGDRAIPEVPVALTVKPAVTGSSQEIIQEAIDRLSSRKPGASGFRGTLLLAKGTYEIPGTLHLDSGGVVLRGAGDGEDGTVLVASGKGQRTLLDISGRGKPQEIPGTREQITDSVVAVGSFSFTVGDGSLYKPGDRILLVRPGTPQWIHDLKMDQIVPRKGTRQWKPEEYDLRFLRTVTRVENNRIFIDNPVMMEMTSHYGGGFICRYRFPGRISQVGVEQIRFRSDFSGDTDEDHGWTAVSMNDLKNGWVRGVTSEYFGYSCVTLGAGASQITVQNSSCLDAKSIITGGRRYSFCNNGQLNLFRDLKTTEGRHDFVTGARTLGPNVFFRCQASRTHADIGPHHRWSVGTLYDNIRTDGEINVQDRGNWGSGHGWAGVTQIIWNCAAKRAAIQSPWVSGKNYCIGLKGGKYPGRLKGRPDGVWEGQNKPGLRPASLYLAQLNERKK